MAQYEHPEQHWGQYRNFENQQEKNYDLRAAGFTTDDRITGFVDIAHEASPPPQKPKPKPKKVNPNLFGFHPKILQQTEQEFNQQQNIALLKDNDGDDNNSLLSSRHSSINRVNDDFANNTNHPIHFKDRGSLQSLPQIDEIPFKQKIAGLICIIIAISCWVSMGHILKNIQSDYDKPYFVSYCITAGLFALIIPWICMYFYQTYNKRQQFTETAFKNETTFVKQEILYKEEIALWKRLILPAFIFCVLIIGCNYFWVLSLDKTMVSVNTTIYQSNVAIIYILSIFLLDNHLTLQKNIGVVLCGVGVVTVLFGAYKEEDKKESGDDDDVDNQVSGIIECIVSVLCYSINAVLFKITANKYFHPNLQIRNTLLLQWMTGLIGLCILWPVMLIFDSVEQEKFQFPQANNDIISLVLSVILNILFFVSFEMAIILTNPVITSMGCLFVLPVGYFSDIIIYDYKVQFIAILGTVAIALGFMLLNVPILAYCFRRRVK